MRDLIIETDLGHDPDDFFAICYLAAAGVRIRCITIVPGDRDQIAVARLIAKRLNLDIPIGASKPDSQKLSSGGVHHALLARFGMPRESSSDGRGDVVIADVVKRYPDCEYLIIGPSTSTARYLASPDARIPERLTMQGGFLGYHLFAPSVRLEQFEGKEWMPTFNLNGDRKGADIVLAAPIRDRRFVGKNVCHTILYDSAVHDSMPSPNLDNAASELFHEGMSEYLKTHPAKKWHDPTAAACHLHPHIGTWLRGRVRRIESGWGTVADDSGDHILADIDRESLWACFRGWH
jgi:inosine-uridine nucleoside N-ribohydrolase